MEHRLLVTGGGGMLAGAIADRLTAPEFEVTATTHADLEITDASQVRDAFEGLRPTALINCAAMSNVDACERDFAAARRANAEGPRRLAEACDRAKIPMIHISTDYVFDGAKGSPFVESDEVNPINAYGESKLLGERAVAEACERHQILRVSMLYGIHRTNFADFVATQIEKSGTVKAVTDNAGSPTHCPDIAAQIEALLDAEAWGVFHCAGDGGCSRLEFAERIRDLMGAEDFEIEAVTQADFPQMLAKRPADSRLECARLKEMGFLRLKPWQEAVGEYLDQRREAKSSQTA